MRRWCFLLTIFAIVSCTFASEGSSDPSAASETVTAPRFPTRGAQKYGLCLWGVPQQDPGRKWESVCGEYDGTTRDSCLEWKRVHFCQWNPSWLWVQNLVFQTNYKDYKLDLFSCKQKCDRQPGCYTFSHSNIWDVGTKATSDTTKPPACRIPVDGYFVNPAPFFHGFVYLNRDPILEWDLRPHLGHRSEPLDLLPTELRGTGAVIENSALRLTGGAFAVSKVPRSYGIGAFSLEVVTKAHNTGTTCHHASIDCVDLDEKCRETWLHLATCGVDSYWRSLCPAKCGQCPATNFTAMPCGRTHAPTKCRMMNQGTDPNCCAAPSLGYCAGGYSYIQGGACENSTTSKSTCCLPNTVLVQANSSVIAFATQHSTLRYMGILFCDQGFRLMASSQTRTNRMRRVQPRVTQCEPVHLMLTSSEDGEVKLYLEGMLVESFKAPREAPEATAKATHAAVILGTAPTIQSIAHQALEVQDTTMTGNYEGEVQLARFYPTSLDQDQVSDTHNVYQKHRKSHASRRSMRQEVEVA